MTAGLFFQRFAHDVHTEQEQGKAAKQGKYMKDRHRFSSLCFRPQGMLP